MPFGPLALALVPAIVGLLMVVPPTGEFPVDIDWNYARAVQTIPERG